MNEIKPGKVLFKAYAEKVSMRRVRRGMTITEAILTDGKEKIKAIWFNQPYRVKQLQDENEFYFRESLNLIIIATKSQTQA